MLLHRLTDAVRSYLVSALPVGSKVGSVLPRVVADLPAVVLSVVEAEPLGAGVGGKPRGLSTGALPLQVAIDLANPVLQFPDETVPLVSADRRTLQLPHSPLVNADGGDAGPLPAGAVVLRRGALTYTLVAANPIGNQVRVDRVTGIAVFGNALPATGSLQASYFVGQWESDAVRFTAVLQADVYATGDGALDALSRQVAQAMASHTVVGLGQLTPQSWGAMAPPGTPAGNTLRRQLAWRCRYEYDDPRVITGGGPIRGIAVSLTPSPGALPANFSIARP